MKDEGEGDEFRVIIVERQSGMSMPEALASLMSEASPSEFRLVHIDVKANAERLTYRCVMKRIRR